MFNSWNFQKNRRCGGGLWPSSSGGVKTAKAKTGSLQARRGEVVGYGLAIGKKEGRGQLKLEVAGFWQCSVDLCQAQVLVGTGTSARAVGATARLEQGPAAHVNEGGVPVSNRCYNSEHEL